MVSSSKTVFVAKGKFLSIVYHDIFNYPLTEKELKIWQVKRVTTKASWVVEKTDNLYHLPGRREIALLRRRRDRFSKVKRIRARRGASIISKIPTVLFIGITGSLSMNNADRESDIDLFLITKQSSLWITRILVHLILALYGVPRRKYESKSSCDKLCLNMWMDERFLVIPGEARNVYAAHEVLQVVPLKNKDMAYERFIYANNWVGEYWHRNMTRNRKHVMRNKLLRSKLRSIPQAEKFDSRLYPRNKLRRITTRIKSSYVLRFTGYVLRALEPLAYCFQLARMRSRRTREIISPTRAFFHPVDWSFLATHEFENKVSKLRGNSTNMQFPLDKQTAVS